MANERIVILAAKGGDPEIEFVIGNAQWGSYRLKIYNKQAKAWETAGEGVSWDSVEDRFEIGKTPKQLNGTSLLWNLVITPMQVGDPYLVRVNMYQDGKVVEGGSITHQGKTLLETHPAAGLVKVVAV